ncbi:MAG: biotin/lipoyl-containing protein, partial [Candidatus Binatia bacterium]
PRTFLTRLGDREVPVEILELEGGRYRVKLDGQEQTLDARRLGSNLVSLLIDGRYYEVSVIHSGDDYDLLLSNHRYRVPLVPEIRARRASAAGTALAGGRQEIKASMPGKVVDVLVKPGDKVEAQQGLLIVEAMKMENEIKAAGPGEVKEIRVKPGKAVEAGELLAVVE